MEVCEFGVDWGFFFGVVGLFVWDFFVGIVVGGFFCGGAGESGVIWCHVWEVFFVDELFSFLGGGVEVHLGDPLCELFFY